MHITSRQFNQSAGAAKKAANAGPVFITDRGQTTHVLLSFEAYSKLAGAPSLAEALACPTAADIDFEPARLENICTPAIFD